MTVYWFWRLYCIFPNRNMDGCVFYFLFPYIFNIKTALKSSIYLSLCHFYALFLCRGSYMADIVHIAACLGRDILAADFQIISYPVSEYYRSSYSDHHQMRCSTKKCAQERHLYHLVLPARDNNHHM